MDKKTLEIQIQHLRRRYLIRPSYPLEMKIKRLVDELAVLNQSDKWNKNNKQQQP